MRSFFRLGSGLPHEGGGNPTWVPQGKYHPQTDGLVKHYNRTLTSMMTKTVKKESPEWEERSPYVLFPYRASQQSLTRESSFYLVYGRDPRLPTPAAQEAQNDSRPEGDLKEYGLELHAKMADLARQCIGHAQKKR